MSNDRKREERLTFAATVVETLKLLLLAIPGAVMAAIACEVGEDQSRTFWIGAVVQATIVACYLFVGLAKNASAGPWIITAFTIALAWLGKPNGLDADLVRVGRFLFIVTPIMTFALHWLVGSGAPAVRRASQLASQLMRRVHWPDALIECRNLPIAQAFRQVVSNDPSPALALLVHPKREVRYVAASSLGVRHRWKPGHRDLVLDVVKSNDDKHIRAEALLSLSCADDRSLVENLATYMLDEHLEVRHAAATAVLSDVQKRWTWVRFTLRKALSNRDYADDGSMLPPDQDLPEEAIKDLTAWCAEKGQLASRSAQLLTSYYQRQMMERPSPKIVEKLCSQLADPKTAAVYRIELARLLQKNHALDPTVLQKMLQACNPATLRLIAAETIVANFTNQRPLFLCALATLREIARLPNRELAVATAEILQRRLGVDMGLGLDQPLPSPSSKQAADVNRRVIKWAFETEDAPMGDDSGMVSY